MEKIKNEVIKMVAVKINTQSTGNPLNSAPSNSPKSKKSTVIMEIFNRLINELYNLFFIKSKKRTSETPNSYAIFIDPGSGRFPKAPQSTSERDLGSIKYLNQKIDLIKQTDKSNIQSCAKIDIETVIEEIEKSSDNCNNIAVLSLALKVIKNLKDKKLISDKTPGAKSIESKLNQKIAALKSNNYF